MSLNRVLPLGCGSGVPVQLCLNQSRTKSIMGMNRGVTSHYTSQHRYAGSALCPEQLRR